VRTPVTTRSASREAVSAVAERRTGAPFSPADPGWNGGSHSAKAHSPRGDASSVTATTGTPVRRYADSSGDDVVAEARTNTGSAP